MGCERCAKGPLTGSEDALADLLSPDSIANPEQVCTSDETTDPLVLVGLGAEGGAVHASSAAVPAITSARPRQSPAGRGISRTTGDSPIPGARSSMRIAAMVPSLAPTSAKRPYTAGPSAASVSRMPAPHGAVPSSPVHRRVLQPEIFALGCTTEPDGEVPPRLLIDVMRHK